MTYNEFLEQANKLEAQAKALRKQAEEAKAEAAKADAKKISAARTNLVNALFAYMQIFFPDELDKNDAEDVVKMLDEKFEKMEKEYRVLNSFLKGTKVNVNGKELSDDEKIAAFLKVLSK